MKLKSTIQNTIQGFTLIELMIVLTILSGLLVTYGPQLIQQQQPISQADNAGKDISEIKAAANAYYMENRAWPATVNELIVTGYLPGTGVSPFGTHYTLGNNGQNLVVSVDTNRDQLANMLAGKVSFGAVAADGETVSTEMGTPSREAIQSFFLARRAVAGCADCNQLASGTDLDINGNDLNNIDEMDVNQATMTNATITTADIDRLAVEQIHLGANSLTYVGDQLDLNAGTVSVNGTLSTNGDVVGNGNHLTGFNTISADTGSFTDLTATNGTITTLSGDTLDYNSGLIDILSGNSLSYANGSITSLDGNNLDYNSGSIDSLSGKSLNFGSGDIGHLVGDDLSFGSGTVNVLNGNTLTYTNVNGTNGSFNSLSANSASVGNLDVTDNLTASNANLAVVNATNVNTNFLTTGIFNASSVNVSGRFSVGGTLNAANVNVSKSTTTNQLQASSSTLGNASASSLNVSGNVNANDVDASSLTADSAKIASLSGNSASFNTVTGNQFSGGTFNGVNFTTDLSSVNNNKSLINQYISKWNSCQSAGGCK